MEVDKETLEEGEVMEAVVEIIKVNNQIVTQIVIIARNLSTWQIIREHDAHNGKLQQGNYASTNNQGDEQFFGMQHMTISMIGGVLDNNV